MIFGSHNNISMLDTLEILADPTKSMAVKIAAKQSYCSCKDVSAGHKKDIIRYAKICIRY